MTIIAVGTIQKGKVKMKIDPFWKYNDPSGVNSAIMDHEQIKNLIETDLSKKEEIKENDIKEKKQ